MGFIIRMGFRKGGGNSSGLYITQRRRTEKQTNVSEGVRCLLRICVLVLKNVYKPIITKESMKHENHWERLELRATIMRGDPKHLQCVPVVTEASLARFGGEHTGHDDLEFRV